jgi:hypothetical protein
VTARPALLSGREHCLGSAQVVAGVQQVDDVLVGRVPFLNLVVAAAIGHVGLAVADARSSSGMG